MNYLIFSLSILDLIIPLANKSSIAMDINCNSLVWKTSKFCTTKLEKNNNIKYGTWFPFGFNKNGKAVNWVQLLSYKKLNKDSFRLNSRFTYSKGEETDGKLDVNCKNKDYYIRPEGVISQKKTWATIPKGSGVEQLSKYLCKRTNAKEEWGYTERTSYLWNHPSPTENPSAASGEWIEHTDGLGWYNTDVRKTKNSVIYAFFSKSQKNNNYFWINSSCIENLGSIFFKPNNSVKGEWLGPKPGKIGGTNNIVREKYCR
tara:strand:+ start:188 stop:964 length:777 start_codon:yes stop_codon:yes gene_type:complete